nr:bromodomain containing protein 8 [Hymenolepis microstoma]
MGIMITALLKLGSFRTSNWWFEMTWNDAINSYLLKCVKCYGKNWSEIRKTLKVLINQFQRDAPKKDFNEQELSIQYKYLIASAIPPESTVSLTEEQLLEIAFNDYCQRRLRKIEEKTNELTRIEAQQERDNKLLEEGRYSEIPEESRLIFRKRLRAFGKRDIIAEVLNLDPLPANPEEDRILRAEYRRGKLIEQGLHRGVFDDQDNLWIPVASAEEARNFFKRPRSDDQSPDQRAATEDDENVLHVEVKDDKDITSTLPSPRKMSNMDVKQPLQLTIGTPRRVSNTTTIKKPLAVSIDGSSTKVHAVFPPSVNLDDMQVTPHRAQKRSAAVASSALKLEHPPSLATSSRLTNRLKNRNGSQQAPPSDAPMASSNSPHGRWRWRRAVQSLLTPASNHRHSHIFSQPVTDEIAPHYSIMIHSPMDLSTIKRNLDARLVAGAAEDSSATPAIQQTVSSIVKQLLHDLLLMFANARMYNNRDHSIHHIAGTMCAEVLAVMHCYCESWPEEIPGLQAILLNPSPSNLPSPNSTPHRRFTTASSIITSTPTSDQTSQAQEPPSTLTLHTNANVSPN